MTEQELYMFTHSLTLPAVSSFVKRGKEGGVMFSGLEVFNPRLIFFSCSGATTISAND